MKHNTQQTLFSLLAATLLTSSLQANETAALEPVNVTASEFSVRDDIKLDSVTNLYRVEKTAEAGTQIFTKEEIEAYAPKDFFDLMDKAVGMDLTYQGRKSPFFLNMRGGGSITYIIDGAILPSTANRILYKIPMSAIEEIQVIRGSTALSLAPSIGIGASNSGSGLNTGFIVIRTKQPKKTEGMISAYGEKTESHPMANGESIFVGTRLGSTESGLSGYIGGMVSRYDRPSQETWFDGSDAQSGMITGGLTFGRLNINLMGYKDEGTFEFQRAVSVTGVIDTSKWYYDPIKTSIISSDMSMQWNEDQTTLASIFKIDYDQTEYSNEKFGQNITPVAKKYNEVSSGYSLRHNARFGNTLVQLGGQYTHSDGNGPNLNSGYNRFDTNILGWSASIEQKLFGGDLILDAGYRRDQKHINNSSTSAAKDAANNDVDMAPAQVVALGALWNITPMFTLNGRYFQGTEGTNGDFDLKTQDGSALHAEEQKRTEIAFEAKITPYFKPMITWFNVDFTNQKSATTNTYTDADGSLYYYYTESDSRRRGIELAIKGKSSGFDYLVAWTHMNENSSTTAAGVTTDSIGESTPENSFTGKIGYAWDNYRANISAKKVDGWTSSTSAGGTSTNVDLGDYTRVDANIAGDFKLNNLTFTAKLYGRNLGDVQYATKYQGTSTTSGGYYDDRGRVVGLDLSMAF